MQKIVPFDVSEQVRIVRHEFEEAVQNVLQTAQSEFPASAFETAFRDFCQTEFCAAFASTTEAAQWILDACGLQADDEVIASCLLHQTLQRALQHHGVVVRLLDMHPETLRADLLQLEALLSLRTKGIICSHFCGVPEEMNYVQQFATVHDLFVIEEASAACGAQYQHKPAGGFGAFTIWFFDQHSLPGCFGAAAAITTNSSEIFAVLQNRSKLRLQPLDPLRTALLAALLAHLPQWLEQQRKIAAIYRNSLKSHPGVGLRTVPSSAQPTYPGFLIQVDNPEVVAGALQKNDVVVGTGRCGRLEHLLDDAMRSRVPVAASVAARLVELPTHPLMSAADAERIAEIVLQALPDSATQELQLLDVSDLTVKGDQK